LTLYFYGDPNNDANATEQMYVGLEDSRGADSYAEVRYGDYGEDMNDVKRAEWTEWNIRLSDFTDVFLTEVAKVYIGFGDRTNLYPSGTPGGSGIVYFDDIRLYRPRCMPLLLRPAGDLDEDCIVGLGDVQMMADEWLETGYELESVANLYDKEPPDQQGINFRDFAVLADDWQQRMLWPEP
jgi:hypothetical protein